MPANTGPTIWPKPKAAVIIARVLRGSPGAIRRAQVRPRAVIPMKVAPRSAAARRMPVGRTHSALAATPTASRMHARANDREIPTRPSTAVHTPTDGAAVNPTRSQTNASRARTWGEARTMATRNVAVMM